MSTAEREWAVHWLDMIPLEPDSDIEPCDTEAAARRLHAQYRTETELLSRTVVRGDWTTS